MLTGQKFVLMGTLAAFAGLIDSFRLLKWWPTMGEGYMLTTFATVFVGGTSISGFWTRLIYGLLILIAVTIHTLLRRGG